jgi:hypothetical protein
VRIIVLDARVVASTLVLSCAEDTMRCWPRKVRTEAAWFIVENRENRGPWGIFRRRLVGTIRGAGNKRACRECRDGEKWPLLLEAALTRWHAAGQL